MSEQKYIRVEDLAEAMHRCGWKHPDMTLHEFVEDEIPTYTPADILSGMWVPVTERLPEKEKKSYLCRTDGGYHCEVRWTDNKYGLWSGGGEWGWSIFDIPKYSKVTHWMPLPDPPK